MDTHEIEIDLTGFEFHGIDLTGVYLPPLDSE